MKKIIFTAVFASLLLSACSFTPGTNDSSAGKTDGQAAAVESNKIFDLGNRGLEKVPMDIFKDTGLEELGLANNRLTGALPAEIRHLSRLKALNASGNMMTGIPAEIGQLSELERLDYSYNQIDTMPNEIAGLSRLKYLSLAFNNYRDIPESILKLPSLETLDLAGNQLKSIPMDKFQLPSIKKIILTDNAIPSADIEALRKALPGTEIVY